MASRICLWHYTGTPVRHQGSRFFKQGCPMCEAKAVKDPTLRDAPPPEDLTGRRMLGNRKWIDWDKVRAVRAAALRAATARRNA